jgi:hypothetical protein
VTADIKPVQNGATLLPRLKRWFLISGAIGLLVAFILFILTAVYVVRPNVLLVLWPSSIAGIADPSNPMDKFIVGLFEFGGNFLLYGTIGAFIALCLHVRTAKCK